MNVNPASKLCLVRILLVLVHVIESICCLMLVCGIRHSCHTTVITGMTLSKQTVCMKTQPKVLKRACVLSAPQISRAPQNLTNYTGNDIAFGCEVSAFPLPNVSWKKNGSDNFLPSDDPHISVQVWRFSPLFLYT